MSNCDMNASFSIQSSNGDSLRIGVSNADHAFLSEKINTLLKNANVEIIEILLQRMKGEENVGIDVLSKIADVIGDFFLENENGILFYYCDDLLTIPTSRHDCLPQEYRNNLFSLLFQRFCQKRNINHIHDMKICIDAVGNPLYMHFIARDKHLYLLEEISEDMVKSYSK